MLPRVVQGQLTACSVSHGDTLLLALSGGRDSVALLHMLCIIEKEGAFAQVQAAHLHHGIRGADADEDAAFVRQLCREWGVPLQLERADVPALAQNAHVSLEQAAREARYAFLERARESAGAAYILTAHHMEDQAETVLLHLLRGSGLHGLQGMRPANGVLLRPLLHTRREEINAYIKERGLPYREDATNRDTAYLRNRVRLELLPLLQNGYNPNIVWGLSSMAELLGEDEVYLMQQAEDALARATLAGLPPVGCSMYDRNALLALPGPLRSRALRLMLRRAGALQGAQRSDVQRLQSLLEGRTGAWIRLPHGQYAWVSYEAIVIGPRQTQADVEYEAAFCCPGDTETPGGIFRAAYAAQWSRAEGPLVAYMDVEKLPGGIVARPRRAGDVFHPLGAPGGKKLKEYLIDKKFPRGERERPLLAAGQDVLFFPGGTVSERVKVGEGTARIVRVEFVPFS